MKRVAMCAGFKRNSLLLGILSAFLAGQANAEKIELYADATMSSCELVDQGTAPRFIHVFYTGTTVASLVRFKAPQPACWVGATWAGDIATLGFISIGNSQTDLSVAFGGCFAPPVHVAQLAYFATGGAQPCCEMVAMAPPPDLRGHTQFVFTDCNFAEHPLSAGQKVVINPNSSCRCQNPLAVEATTWGRVKSLYR